MVSSIIAVLMYVGFSEKRFDNHKILYISDTMPHRLSVNALLCTCVLSECVPVTSSTEEPMNVTVTPNLNVTDVENLLGGNDTQFDNETCKTCVYADNAHKCCGEFGNYTCRFSLIIFHYFTAIIY